MKHAYLPVALLVFGAAAPAAADRRAFTRTYEYQTMPEAETELELYSTQSRIEDEKTFELQLELEHGLTERWDVSLYHVFEQVSTPDASGPFRFEEIKLRTRYRFSERGELPVDLLAYLEAGRAFGPHAYEVEAKAIVARDLGPVTAVINLIGEVAIEDVDGTLETTFVPAWAAGLTYEVMPELKLGVETWGERPLDEDETGEIPLEALVGPAVSWAPASSFWATVTAGFGLTDHSDDYSVRLLVGVGL